MNERIKNAADAIAKACGNAEIGLILGSGLADSISLENAKTISYQDIPAFPVSTATGHKSEWVCGELGGRRVCMMRGRFHAYEGYSSEDLILPIRVMKTLGVRILIITNAAGGVNQDFRPGDLMLITDHIGFCGVNPLIGQNDDSFGTRFPDMSKAYDPELRRLAKRCAEELGIPLREGVYFRVTGPSFETPAEIRAIRLLGGDATGMSTIPEVIAARHCGIRVLGISCITNMAAGILDQPLTHEEVMETGARVSDSFASLIRAILERL